VNKPRNCLLRKKVKNMQPYVSISFQIYNPLGQFCTPLVVVQLYYIL
jgi:hypothetical protein